MDAWCPNCGRQVADDEKFCRQCGMPQELTGEEATTWLLSPDNPTPPRRTARANTPATGSAGAPTSAAYLPPSQYYQPPAQYPAPVHQTVPPQHGIRLGDWLTGGWQVYKENWALMSVATLIGVGLSICTLGILAGPILMGMFAMAFRTMRGEQPVMGDLFNWRGRFLQAFLAFLIFFVAQWALAGLGSTSSFFQVVHLAVTPLFAIMLSLAMPRLLETGHDVVKSVNEIVKRVLSRDWFSWWLVGLVISAIASGGTLVCAIGGLVTLPWMICTGAVAYRDTFGLDDPNRTNQ
jgi:hypothetical protein